MSKTILAVDDDPATLTVVDEALTLSHHLVLRAENGERALALARQHHPDLILLDIMMPGIDGLEVCRRLRRDPVTASIPIMMLTALDGTVDEVLGLENGADDYLAKPFDVHVLRARVKALLRRGETGPGAQRRCIRSGTLALDLERHRVTCDGREVALTLAEFNLLKALAGRPGRVLTREDLVASTHSDESAVSDRAVDAHVAALRRKLGTGREWIETVRGVGYRLREPEDPQPASPAPQGEGSVPPA